MESYIAHPYWPERDMVIDVQKKSGANRQRSEEKRRAAIEAELNKRGMSYADYEAAMEKAADQWYRKGSTIIIPRHQLAGAFVQVVKQSPKALRGDFSAENFRALVQIGDFETDRNTADGVFGRFVKLETSNQRSWQENEYIGIYLDNGATFLAVGTIAMHEKLEKTVKSLLESALANVGVGASRKMGFGRGRIVSWS